MPASTPKQEFDLSSGIETTSLQLGLSFGQVVRLALKGHHLDYTSVPLNRAVLLLAVPMVLEMIMESLFAVVDVFWVSRLGSDAIAVVGLTESVMALVYAVAIGISIAATAIIARRIGEGEPERASQAAGQVLLLGVIISVAIGLLLSYFAADILRLMGASERIVSLGTDFARVMFGCNVTVFTIFLINAVLRGAGDAVLAMRTMWLSNALNIVLGPLFIFGWGPCPELGVTGAALATNIGRGVGVLYQLWHLAGLRSRVKVRLRNFTPVWVDLLAILRTAGTGIVQLLIGMTSWVGLFKIVAAFGSAPLAGYTIAMRVVMFALMPAWGLANAGATLVGQNLGAGKPERAEQAIWIATRFNMIFLGMVGLMFVLGSESLIRLFTDDPLVLEHGIRALWIVSLAFPLYAAGMCLQAAFNGAGDTWTSARLNFFGFWLGQIPLAWLLANFFRLGPVGVFVAVPVGFSVLALLSFVVFRRGRWKQRRI
jgi:putative MATE family efflux protein